MYNFFSKPIRTIHGSSDRWKNKVVEKHDLIFEGKTSYVLIHQYLKGYINRLVEWGGIWRIEGMEQEVIFIYFSACILKKLSIFDFICF